MHGCFFASVIKFLKHCWPPLGYFSLQASTFAVFSNKPYTKQPTFSDSPTPPPHFLPSPPPPPLLLLIFPPPSPLAILPSPQNLLIEFFWVCLSILSLITTTKSFTL